MKMKDQFTNDVLYAILRRKKEVNLTYVFLSKLMKRFDMSIYTEIVDDRIFEDEAIGYAIENNHVVMDLYQNDILLDEVALHWFRPIMEGYISHEDYEKYLDYIESYEKIRRYNNLLLQTYQKMNIYEISKTVFIHMKKYRKTNPWEVRILCCWCGLELLSKTRIPFLIIYIKELPLLIRNKFILKSFEKYIVDKFVKESEKVECNDKSII